MTLDIELQTTQFEPRPDFHKVVWPEYRELLSKNLAQLVDPRRAPTISSIADFDDRLSALNRAIADTNTAKVPESKPSPRSKRWWTPELSEQRKMVLRLGRKAHRNAWKGDVSSAQAFHDARAAYGKAIAAQKTQHWFEWTTSMTSTSTDIWTAARFVGGGSTDGCKTRVPTLVLKDPVSGQTVRKTTNSDKAQTLRDAFFPPPANLSHSPDHSSNTDPAWTFRLPSDIQIQRTFQRLTAGKATCRGTPPNDLLRNCADLLAPHIGPLY